MKVLYILSSSGKFGGATKSFLNMLTYMHDLGYDTTVVLPDKNGLYHDLKKLDISVCPLRYYFDCIPGKGINQHINKFTKRFINFIGALRLYSLCKKIKPDVIHSNTSVNNIGYLTAKWLHIPHIWHIREYGEKDFGFSVRKLYDKITSPHNYVITITRDLAKEKGIDNNKNQKTIYNGIISSSSNVSSDIKEDYFLYAGRIEKAKGIDDLILAFIDYKKNFKSNIKLKIAGRFSLDNPLKKELDKIITNNHMESEIQWLGEIQSIRPLMRKAKATIVPSRFEGFGRVTAEAMAEGSLVIGRNTAGTKEQFDNGLELTGCEIGFRFHSLDELKECMHKVENLSDAEYDRITTNARRTVHELYSTENYGFKIDLFYKEILQNEKAVISNR